MTNIVNMNDRRTNSKFIKTEQLGSKDFRLVPVDLTIIKATLIAISTDDDYIKFSGETEQYINSIELALDPANQDIPFDELFEGMEDSNKAWQRYFRYLFEQYSNDIDPLGLLLQNPFD